MDIKTTFLPQLDAILEKYEQIQDELDGRESQYENISSFFVSALAAIDRIAGEDSTYAKQAHEYTKNGPTFHPTVGVGLLAGVVSALRNDVAADFMTTTKELIHAEMFSDFLEMADFLLSGGYKDAAAVIGGGVLETHLHQLCLGNGIDVETLSGNQTQVKKADRLNNDLASKNVYNKLLQKHVTTWLDLRNKAAHAQYSEYTHHDVTSLLQGVRDFVSRYPA